MVTSTKSVSKRTYNSSRKHITVDVVKRLKPNSVVWDTSSKTREGVSGFMVRCQRRDRVYMLKTRVHGRVRYYTIGKHGDPWTPAEARQKAKDIKVDIAAGKDPFRERDEAKKAPALAAVADLFLSEHVDVELKPSTAASYHDMLRRLILPKIGTIRVRDVVEGDIKAMHRSMRKTPRQANLCVAIMSKLLSWSEGEGFRARGTNPCPSIKRYPENKKERFLSDAEFRRLGAALAAAESSGDEDVFIVAAIRLLILTGARLGEVLSLQWDHVKFDRAEIELPDSKTGAKKIYLNAPALQLLNALPRVKDNPYVFPGRRKGASLVNIQRPWERIRKRAGLEDVRLHDLRHSYASVAVAGGGTLPMIGRILGHSNTATTERYAHLHDDPVRQLNEKAGSAISAAMSPGDGEVTDIGNAR